MDRSNSALLCEFAKAILKLSDFNHFLVHVEKLRRLNLNLRHWSIAA